MQPFVIQDCSEDGDKFHCLKLPFRHIGCEMKVRTFMTVSEFVKYKMECFVNFHEAKSKALFKKIVGVVIALPAIISTAISVLKMLYFRLDDGTKFGSAIAKPFKQLVQLIYENTHILNLFWQHSPTPDLADFLNRQNLYFFAVYVLFFVGLAYFSSGGQLSRRLRKISQKIEDQLIEESIKGSASKNRQQIEESIEVPSSTIFSQLHQLYFAPVITAVVGAIILKLMGV
ncbi:YniB family protein [Shewanella mangrovisoli]|uniref:YniB family protein n=2 Tax=Shewanella mangrovisoli TaxID=2864211 RepID=UPI0035B98E90